jgi:hypothetical protein
MRDCLDFEPLVERLRAAAGQLDLEAVVEIDDNPPFFDRPEPFGPSYVGDLSAVVAEQEAGIERWSNYFSVRCTGGT